MEGRWTFVLSIVVMLCTAYLVRAQDVDPICLQPKKVGNCRASIPRFYYDSANGACTPFTYGGCDANENNFETMEDCKKKCEP